MNYIPPIYLPYRSISLMEIFVVAKEIVFVLYSSYVCDMYYELFQCAQGAIVNTSQFSTLKLFITLYFIWDYCLSLYLIKFVCDLQSLHFCCEIIGLLSISENVNSSSAVILAYSRSILYWLKSTLLSLCNWPLLTNKLPFRNLDVKRFSFPMEIFAGLMNFGLKKPSFKININRIYQSALWRLHNNDEIVNLKQWK